MDNTPDTAGNTSSDTSDLAGLWDFSMSAGPGIVDIAYLGLTDDSILTVYDYAGDAVNEGGNCYLIDSGPLTRIKDNEFQGRTLEVFIMQVVDDHLNITQIVDREGEPVKDGTAVYPRVTGLSPVDFIPCD